MSDTDRKPMSDGSDDDDVQQPLGERTGFGSGRMPSAAIPMEKSLDFTGSVKRLLRRMGSDAALLVLVLLLASSASPSSSSARRCSATRPT